LGEELRRLREKAGLTQAEVEAKLGRHNTWVSRVEKGTRYIDFPTMLDFIALTDGDAPEIIRQVQERATKHYKSLGQRSPYSG